MLAGLADLGRFRLEYVHEEFETLSDLTHPNIVHVLEKMPKAT